MLDQLADFYSSKEEPNRSCWLALRDIILNKDDKLTETVKYGMPCFTYGKEPLCYLWVDKKTTEPYILMVDGNFLDHPLLEVGSRAKMKILRVNPKADLPLEAVESVLKQALELFRKS